VTINSASESDDGYADIKLIESQCPFLAEGLCSIQAQLGEEYLSKNCAAYPRVMHSVEGVLERALDLSCPEAARLALMNPEQTQFVEQAGDDNSPPGSVGIVDTTNSKHPDKPYRYIHEIRSLMISLLQNRRYPLSQRLLVLGRLCDKLEQEGSDHRDELADIAQKPSPFDRASRPAAKPEERLETVVELILCRIGSDHTTRRFLDCYREFMHGLHWTNDSTMEQLGARFEELYLGNYTRFVSSYGYMLENYLVTYVFVKLFPFGSKPVNQKLAAHAYEHSISSQYRLMIVDFVIVETLLTGLAGCHGDAFGADHAVRLIQATTKTFEHSLAYPGRALQLLKSKGLTTSASMAALIRD
jgi:lysine-N-methylase